MAKNGMKRPEIRTTPKNEVSPVPQIQGNAKTGKEKARPIIAGTHGANMKVWHERYVPADIYPEIDTDLARDNIENDIPFADRQDLQ